METVVGLFGVQMSVLWANFLPHPKTAEVNESLFCAHRNENICIIFFLIQ